MKILLIIISIIFSQHNAFSEEKKSPVKEKTIKQPKDLIEAFEVLKELLPKEEIEKIKKTKDMSKFHFGLGRWIRNNFGLWRESDLQNHLFDQAKNLENPVPWLRYISHPDNQSSFILDSFKKHLNNPKLTEKQLFKEKIDYLEKQWNQSQKEETE